MRKIVINTCYGGFSISKEAGARLVELGLAPELSTAYGLYWDTSNRDSPLLIQVVEELGKKANGDAAELKIVEIPDDVDWTIEEYDGQEWVAEKHRCWS